MDENGEIFNFFVSEAEGLKWKMTKTQEGVKQQSFWGKQPNHAIDAFSYVLSYIKNIGKTVKKIVRKNFDTGSNYIEGQENKSSLKQNSWDANSDIYN